MFLNRERCAEPPQHSHGEDTAGGSLATGHEGMLRNMDDGAYDRGAHVSALCRALAAFKKHAARVKRSLDIDREACRALRSDCSCLFQALCLLGDQKVLDAFAKQVASAFESFTEVNRNLAVISPRKGAMRFYASCFDAGCCGSDPEARAFKRAVVAKSSFQRRCRNKNRSDGSVEAGH